LPLAVEKSVLRFSAPTISRSTYARERERERERGRMREKNEERERGGAFSLL
jgi:hypothetical protein